MTLKAEVLMQFYLITTYLVINGHLVIVQSTVHHFLGVGGVAERQTDMEKVPVNNSGSELEKKKK